MMTALLQILRQRLPSSLVIAASDSGTIKISDSTVERGKGYTVDIQESFKSYKAVFEFDSFAMELCRHAEKQLNDSGHPIRDIFQAKDNIKLNRLRVTIEDVFTPGATNSDGWWLEFEYRKISSQPKDDNSFADILLSLLLFLLPYDFEGEEEGAAADSLSTRYERSKANRSLCLAFHGYQCKACGINLEDQYGDVARRFIHVHHVNPLFATGVTKPDPVRDMVPLCPNCHGIAHLQNAPYSIEEIKSMIIENNGKIFA
jgi:hypothetical protein